MKIYVGSNADNDCSIWEIQVRPPTRVQRVRCPPRAYRGVPGLTLGPAILLITFSSPSAPPSFSSSFSSPSHHPSNHPRGVPGFTLGPAILFTAPRCLVVAIAG